MPPLKARNVCTHTTFALDGRASTPPEPVASVRRSGRIKTLAMGDAIAGGCADKGYPPPQTFPGDALFGEVAEERQSFQRWQTSTTRNRITDRKQTIYICEPPGYSDQLNFLTDWKTARLAKQGLQSQGPGCPSIDHIVQYIAAFYWPLPIVKLPKLDLIRWHAECRARPTEQAGRRQLGFAPQIGLADHSRNFATKIDTRQKRGGPYLRQFRVDDLLDGLSRSLPKDAYAAILLLEHDLYEDEDDDFIVGRAYGGSRVAVVSMARYNPVLDNLHAVSFVHAWPLNYCADFAQKRGFKVSECTVVEANGPNVDETDPLQAAIRHDLNLGVRDKASVLSKSWLFRVCRTVSHELGHCFGIAHCSEYGCIMQSSANLSEDARQPPYFCPVDLDKILAATCTREVEWFDRMSDVTLSLGPEGGFGAFATWARVMRDQVLAAPRS